MMVEDLDVRLECLRLAVSLYRARDSAVSDSGMIQLAEQFLGFVSGAGGIALSVEEVLELKRAQRNNAFANDTHVTRGGGDDVS